MSSKQRQIVYMVLGIVNVAAIAMVDQHLVSGTNLAICQAISFGVAMLMKEWSAQDSQEPPK